LQSSARINVVSAIRRMPLPPNERRAARYASPGDSAKVCPDFALILLRARLPSGRTAMGNNCTPNNGTPTSISRRYAGHEGRRIGRARRRSPAPAMSGGTQPFRGKRGCRHARRGLTGQKLTSRRFRRWRARALGIVPAPAEVDPHVGADRPAQVLQDPLDCRVTRLCFRIALLVGQQQADAPAFAARALRGAMLRPCRRKPR
jgi:hypothetical protein